MEEEARDRSKKGRLHTTFQGGVGGIYNVTGHVQRVDTIDKGVNVSVWLRVKRIDDEW